MQLTDRHSIPSGKLENRGQPDEATTPAGGLWRHSGIHSGLGALLGPGKAQTGRDSEAGRDGGERRGAGVEIQLGRIRDGHRSKDPDAVWTVFIDIEFLISSLWKMRLAGNLALSVTAQSWTALHDFDVAVPNLKLMRDVMQHLDEYGRDGDGRRHRNPRSSQLIGRRYLHSQMSFDDHSFNWLGGALDFDQAHNASLQLLSALREARADADEN
ncbi:hypothetical protein [Mycobacterium marseillense]|nr:hypothetical protein [Mycobacterium marseillense]